MGTIHVVVDDSVEDKFRKKFVRKRGDLSKKIEELIIQANKK